jgi:hypothetical protein
VFIKIIDTYTGMIEPVNIVLPSQAADFGRHKTGKDQHFKPNKYIYIPILKQLERILNLKDIYSEVNEIKKLKTTEYSSFELGQAFKVNYLFKTFVEALQILL